MADKLKSADLKETLASAEAELLALEVRQKALREYIDVTRRLCSKNPRLEEGTGIVRMRRTKTSDIVGEISAVLKEHGAPMHVKEILDALARRGHPLTAKNPMAALAVALTRRPESFRRIKPNTFELVAAVPLKEVTIAS